MSNTDSLSDVSSVTLPSETSSVASRTQSKESCTWLVPLMGTLALVLAGVLVYYYWCDWNDGTTDSDDDYSGSVNIQAVYGSPERMTNQGRNGNSSGSYQPSKPSGGKGGDGTLEDVDASTLAKYMKQYPEMVVAFVSNGCGHCVNMKPALHKAAKKSKVKMVTCHAHRDGVMDLLKLWQIMGFPTVLRIKNGAKGEEYNGNRQEEDLIKFCNKYQ